MKYAGDPKHHPEVRAIVMAHVPATLPFSRTTIYTLAEGEQYLDASPRLRGLGINVDFWPAPPAGLYVVDERTLYLRSRSPMTVVHELGHALDHELGQGRYLTADHPPLRASFAAARKYVSPYAATAIDEFFAECFRAFCDANEEGCFWPPVSRSLLAARHPEVLSFLLEVCE